MSDPTKLETLVDSNKDGIFVLDFDENGNCRQLREWWHLKAEGG